MKPNPNRGAGEVAVAAEEVLEPVVRRPDYPGAAHRAWLNDIKLRRDGHQPEYDLGQRDQPAGLAGLAGLVPAAGALGLALVTPSGPRGHQVAVVGDLEGQVGCELVKALRGKRIRSR